MHDNVTQDRFIELRSKGWSFDRISKELSVSKPTLIEWSRKFQFRVQNLRAIELEAMREQHLATHAHQVQTLGRQLASVESELSKRNVAELSTRSLFSLAQSLRHQLQTLTGTIQFTVPVNEIPEAEKVEEAQSWKP